LEKITTTDEDLNLWWLLDQARHLVFRVRQKELDAYNISVRQAAALLVIQAAGERATPARISRLLLREPHSFSESLDTMEKKGLVRRVKDLERKNQVRVVLTEKGREVYYQSTKRKSIHLIMSSLSEEERQQLRHCLQILGNKALKELGIEHGMLYPPSQ